MTTPKVNWSEKDQFYWLRGAFGEVLTFDNVLDVQAAAHRIEIENAVKAREALIAEWLRKHGMRQTAMMLEKGEHLK
jgi:hypothetical protein